MKRYVFTILSSDIERILGTEYPKCLEHPAMMAHVLWREVMNLCKVSYPLVHIKVCLESPTLSDSEEEITGTLREMLLREISTHTERLKKVLLAMVPKTDVLEFVEFDVLAQGLNVRPFMLHEHDHSSLRLYPLDEIRKNVHGDSVDMCTFESRIKTLPKGCWVKVFR